MLMVVIREERLAEEAGVGDRTEAFGKALLATIYGGSAQIQRNFLAERCLGLPR
jgi:alkylation response protein AidB-like acyl-CoA dehydrogenase